MKISTFINPLRPYIHRLRMAIIKLLGINAILERLETAARESAAVSHQFDSDRLYSISDRIALLEAQVNWRLYGLPAKIENIKLEQMALLSGSGDVEKSLDGLKHLVLAKIPFERFVQPPASVEGLAFLLAGETEKELSALLQSLHPQTRCKVGLDTANLFAADLRLEESAQQSILKVNVASMPAAFHKAEYDYIWLSSVIERITTIQAKTLFDRCFIGLKSGKFCTGIFQNFSDCDPGVYWTDPRRMRPITVEYVRSLLESSQFNQIEFVKGDQGWMQFKAVKA